MTLDLRTEAPSEAVFDYRHACEAEHIEAILRSTRWVRQECGDMNLCALSTVDLIEWGRAAP